MAHKELVANFNILYSALNQLAEHGKLSFDDCPKVFHTRGLLEEMLKDAEIKPIDPKTIDINKPFSKYHMLDISAYWMSLIKKTYAVGGKINIAGVVTITNCAKNITDALILK